MYSVIYGHEMSKGAGQTSKNEGREREMAEKHALNRPGCISKHQELARQVSKGQSTMIIDTLHKALSSSIFSSHRLQVCKVTSYVGEY